MARRNGVCCACSLILGLALPVFGADPVAPGKPAADSGKPAAEVAKPAADMPAEGGAFRRGEKLPPALSDLIDGDGDGKVSDAEAKVAVKEFEKQGNTKAVAPENQAIRKALDTNGDGKVDAKEAAAAVAQGRAQIDPEAEKAAFFFKQLDADANGKLTPVEIKTFTDKFGPVLGKIMLQKLGESFVQIDTNRDGVLDETETQLASEYFAQVTQQKKEQAEQQRNAQVWQATSQQFLKLDRNRDKRISEYEASDAGLPKEQFAAIDTNNDNKIAAEELYQFLLQGTPKTEEPRRRRPERNAQQK